MKFLSPSLGLERVGFSYKAVHSALQLIIHPLTSLHTLPHLQLQHEIRNLRRPRRRACQRVLRRAHRRCSPSEVHPLLRQPREENRHPCLWQCRRSRQLRLFVPLPPLSTLSATNQPTNITNIRTVDLILKRPNRNDPDTLITCIPPRPLLLPPPPAHTR